jgi:hypothetical protein
MNVSARTDCNLRLSVDAEQEKHDHELTKIGLLSRLFQRLESRKKDQAFEGLESSVCEQGAAPPIMTVFAKPSISATLTDKELSFDA